MEKLWDYKNALDKRYVSDVAVVSVSGKTITISTLGWTNNQRKNYNVKVVSGTGIGQERRIVANTATLITVERLWDVALDNTSKFDIQADYETIYMVGNAFSGLFKYDYNKDMRRPSNFFDFGTARNGGIAYGGQEAFGITSGTYLAAGITSLTAIPVNKGTGYSIGDVLTIDAKGGKCVVETISAGGLVETVALVNAGTSTYTTGTKTVTGGTGTSCTVGVAAVGKVCKIVSASNVNLAIGDAFVLSGISAAGYNGASAVHAIETLTSFDILCPSASGNMAFTASQSATVLVDSTKNRTINEHVGRYVCHQIAGYNGATLWRRITANDATSLTFATITTAAVNGLGRYFIADCKPFGKAKQYLAPNQLEEGFATSGSPTVLTDSTKAWIPGCWIGYRVRITSGTGQGTEIAITANDTTTLTTAGWGFTPDATTEYQIMDTYGMATGTFAVTTLADSTKNWKVNQWAGMRLRLTCGVGQNLETVIASNTATVLTFATITPTVPDATTGYAILDSNSSTATGRGLATEFIWDFYNNNGRYCYAFRGGNTNIIDRYDITTEKYDIVYFNGYGQSEFFTTGTNYVFDGKGRVYINPNGSQRVLYYDILLNKIMPFAQMPDTQGTAIIGNRMEIISGEGNTQFLCVNRQSTVNFYTVLLPTY